jgi:outer membrane biosynthesis protein TonB
MKRFTVVNGIFLSLVLGTALIAVAQNEHPSERPPNAPQEPKETRPEPAQRPEQPQSQEQMRQRDQERPQQQARPDDRRNQEPESGNRKNTTPQSEGRQPQDQQSGDRHLQGRETHENGQTHDGRPENGQQTAFARNGGEQLRVRDEDFRAHFGREHHFAPRILQPYQGKPSFSYSGYTFVLVEAWPSQWVYDDDDYYIDYVDGEYWMYNVLYPGARIELIIVE